MALDSDLRGARAQEDGLKAGVLAMQSQQEVLLRGEGSFS